MYIIFLGAPGAGKGTQAASVARELNLMHIASGDLFRQAVERGDKLGSKVKAYIDKGILVPDEITIQMILERVSALDCQDGVILDGFPRTVEQAKALDRALGERGQVVDRALYIRVSSEELLRRLSGRWICHQCQKPYHTLSSPPQVPGVCDRCGGELYQREDDQEETVRRRLEVYLAQTAPVIDYYRGQGKLLEVNGEQGVEEVGRELLRVLGTP